jgi:uncharacterized protein (DUF433 family)
MAVLFARFIARGQPQPACSRQGRTQRLVALLSRCVRGRRFAAMLDWTQCAAVERVPGKVSGAWVFKTTRVPARALFENLEDGATVNEFLSWFPGVTREQVEAVLEHAGRSLAVA